MRGALALVFAVMGLLTAAPAATAVGLTVDSLADSEGETCSTTTGCTLREAVGLVAEGEEGPEELGGDVTIDFDVTGSIEIDAEFELFLGEGVDSLTILGPGRDDLTIDAQSLSRAFTVDEGEVKISGLTVENGSVTGFAVDGDGGGALFQAGGAVTLEDVHFTDNHIESTRAGGAIDVEGGDLTIVDSTIDHNSTDADVEGPGGGINVDAGDSTLTLRGTEVDDNFAEGPGGGIYQDEGNLVIADGSTVNGNESTYYGGGIATDADGERTTTISATEISGNKADEGGGGVSTENGIGGIEIVETTISANKAEEGGGVSVDGPTTIASSTISGNEATSSAAGGVDVDSALLVLDSSTLAENTGGGLSVFGGEVLVRASTIAANTNPNGLAGGITGSENNITIKVRSSIVAGNNGESGPGDCAAEVVSEGHNILGTTDPGCSWPQGEGDQLGAAPQLGPLSNHGGPTQTMAPSTRTSPAINHGGNPKPQDQRGLTRPVPVGAGFTDVGAVEVQAPVNEAAPSISPSTDLVEGDELACAQGGWDTDTVTDPSYATAWLADGAPLATGSTYELKTADAGKDITCQVSADNGATVTAASSAAVELAPGSLDLAPSSHDFGGRNVGAGPSAPQALILSNDGAAAVTVGGATSNDSGQFPVDASDCTAAPLGPGAECTIEARFSPTSAGSQAATVTVQSNGGSPSAALSGTGTLGAIAISPTSHDFGSRRTGSGPSTAQVFEVSSSGTGPVTISSASIEGAADFAIPAGGDECAALTLEPGEKCDVEVTFSAAATGARSATLKLSGSAPTATAGLSGTGTAPAFAASPAAVEFGSRQIDSGAATVPISISNAGSAPMSIGNLTISGPGASSFQLSTGKDECSGASLEPSESCTVEVGFEPKAVAPISASLEVPSDAPTGTVPLSGTGTTPPQPPAPPAGEPSASVVGDGGTPYTANGAGELPMAIACSSPAGTPCQVTLALRTASGSALGSWSGALAAGTSETIAVPLSVAGRAQLGAKGRLVASVALGTAGGRETNSTLTLVAPKAPKMTVRSAARAGNAIVFKVSCAGYASPCRGRLALSDSTTDLTAGQVSVAKGTHRVRLPLSGAGRRLLALEPRPRVLAEAVARDRVYQRATAAKTRLRLG